MIDVVVWVVMAAALAFAAWSLYAVARNQPPREPHVIGAGVVEALVLIQTVIAIVMLVASDTEVDTATFVGYLIVTPMVLPAALFWALAEKSRWGTTVLAVGAATVAVLVLRLQQVWEWTPVG